MLKWFRKGGVTPFEKQIVENVDRHGCHINWVFDEDKTDPAFAYSIGFTKTLNFPEVVIFGLPQETCGPAINALLAMCAAGQSLKDGERLKSFFGEYDCIVRTVDESWLIQSYFASALWYHRTQMGRALRDVVMLVWPDADHKFPWEDGCAEWVCADQPALYEPRIAA
ncbi:MAG: DUF4262 domain-containing protein [Sphingomonadales bacterium]|nr:DUF4262 domain-containing protein [Sphingomonadales bacterium]